MYQHINIINYSYKYMLGGSVAYAGSPETILKIWWGLVCFDLIVSRKNPQKFTYFCIKNNNNIATRLLWGTYSSR